MKTLTALISIAIVGALIGLIQVAPMWLLSLVSIGFFIGIFSALVTLWKKAVK